MKYSFALIILSCGIVSCSHNKAVTERVVVEHSQDTPSRETVVERRIQPTLDGERMEERVVQERIIPRTRVERTETTTTRE